MGWQRHQLDHMQITCTSLQTDNHASASLLNFFTGQMLFLMPSQQCQSTEGSQPVKSSNILHTSALSYTRHIIYKTMSYTATYHNCSANLRLELWFYLWIRRYKAESFRDLRRSGTTTDVKKVSRFTTVQFNYVHRGHCQTGTIHCQRSHMQNSDSAAADWMSTILPHMVWP